MPTVFLTLVRRPTLSGCGNLTPDAYGRRITGVGLSYRERLKDQVACGEYGEMLVFGSLSIHLMTQHGRSAGRRRQWTTPAAGSGPQIYRMSFTEKGGPQKCPMAGGEWRRGRQCGCT